LPWVKCLNLETWAQDGLLGQLEFIPNMSLALVGIANSQRKIKKSSFLDMDLL